jgi:predicted secreted protein
MAVVLLAVMMVAGLACSSEPPNQPPTIIGLVADPASLYPGDGATVSCEAADLDGDTLSYAWEYTGGALQGAGSTVTWIAPSVANTYTVKVVVSDSKGGSVNQSVAIIVSVNHAPVISSVSPSPMTVEYSGSSTITCAATDADGDTLSYGWSSGGGVISGAGNIVTWTAPTEEGVYSIAVTVSDGKGGTITGSAFVTVEAPAVNQAPVITSLVSNPMSVVPSADASISCFATDADSDPLGYSWNASAGTITGSGGDVSWTAPATEGSCTVSVVVSDGKGGTDSRSLTISVSVVSGSLEISSTPAGATIYIDGSSTGSITPCTIAGLTPGSHTVKLSKTYYKNKTGTETVVAGSTAGVNWALTSAPSTTINISPSAATGKDSYVIKSSPTSNRGDYTALYAGANAVGQECRTYLEFSLGLPSTANITNAKLGLWYLGTGNATKPLSVGAYRVTSVWNESAITWNNKPTYYAYAYSYATVPAAVTGSYVEWDMKYIVQYWVKGTYPNRGVMLMDSNEATAEAWKGFYSSDWSNALQRPKLTITYWDPGS